LLAQFLLTTLLLLYLRYDADYLIQYQQQMDIEKYIESGVLEEYCLGMLDADARQEVVKMCKLFPRIQEELLSIERFMEKSAAEHGVAPGDHLRQQILNSLGFDETPAGIDPDDLPATNASSSHYDWLNALRYLIPEEPEVDFYSKVLRENNEFAQMLVITKSNVHEEVHENVMESFFILKGECRCTVGDKQIILKPGDFLEIPLHTKHDVKILSPYVVAILQHQYIYN
jgi:mannose-6-phosphate isomerase-like protein (cupin superfamily)